MQGCDTQPACRTCAEARRAHDFAGAGAQVAAAAVLARAAAHARAAREVARPLCGRQVATWVALVLNAIYPISLSATDPEAVAALSCARAP